MINLSKFAGIVFGAAVLLTGCKGKDGDPGPAGATGAQGPAGPAGPTLTGSIVGFIRPVDEFSRDQIKSGVTVTLENTNPLQTVTTDANGRYELTNVKSGTYNIAFSKAGYGTSKVQGYPHAGGDQPAFLYERSIVGVSRTTVPTVNVGAVVPPSQSNGNNDYSVPVTATLANAYLPSSGYSLYGAMFVGNSAGVNSTNGMSAGTIYYTPGQTQYPYYLSRATLNQFGLVTGTTAYLIVYGSPTSYYGDYSYYDTTTGRPVYTALSATPSRVVSFIVP